MLITQICEHNQLTVTGGKRTGNCRACDKLVVNEAFFVPNMTPKFNMGLGCITSGTRDAEKKAKQRGLVPIGDAKAHQVFKQEKVDTITPIINEGRKKLKDLGSI